MAPALSGAGGAVRDVDTSALDLAARASEVAAMNFAVIVVPLAGAIGRDFMAVGELTVFAGGGGNANSFGWLIVMPLAFEMGAGNANAPAAGNAFGAAFALGNGRNA